MTQLRQKMLEELQRRNYSHRTAKTYLRIVRDFAQHFHRSPDKLGPELPLCGPRGIHEPSDESAVLLCDGLIG